MMQMIRKVQIKNADSDILSTNKRLRVNGAEKRKYEH